MVIFKHVLQFVIVPFSLVWNVYLPAGMAIGRAINICMNMRLSCLKNISEVSYF